jgi:hypothetical protein
MATGISKTNGGATGGDSMNSTTFCVYRRLSRSIISFDPASRVAHPVLEACELDSLARRIAASEGLAHSDARLQIAEFRARPSMPALHLSTIDTTAGPTQRWQRVKEACRPLFARRKALVGTCDLQIG